MVFEVVAYEMTVVSSSFSNNVVDVGSCIYVDTSSF